MIRNPGPCVVEFEAARSSDPGAIHGVGEPRVPADRQAEAGSRRLEAAVADQIAAHGRALGLSSLSQTDAWHRKREYDRQNPEASQRAEEIPHTAPNHDVDAERCGPAYFVRAISCVPEFASITQLMTLGPAN